MQRKCLGVKTPPALCSSPEEIKTEEISCRFMLLLGDILDRGVEMDGCKLGVLNHFLKKYISRQKILTADNLFPLYPMFTYVFCLGQSPSVTFALLQIFKMIIKH